MNSTPVSSLHPSVQEIVESLKRYRPDKIILFGSAAAGTWKQGSDVDLLVIKNTDESYWKRQIHATLLYKGWTPTDIIVVTPQEWSQAIQEQRFFVTEEIIKKGKIVYEKSHSTVSQ